MNSHFIQKGHELENAIGEVVSIHARSLTLDDNIDTQQFARILMGALAFNLVKMAYTFEISGDDLRQLVALCYDSVEIIAKDDLN